MRLLRIIGITAVLLSLVFSGVGLLLLRQRNAEFDNQAAQVQAQLEEANAQLKSAKEENDRIKQEFDCMLQLNRSYGFEADGFRSYRSQSSALPLP